MEFTRSQSQQIIAEAQQCIPGGVNSPVRSFQSIGIPPPVFKQAKGALLTDIDHNTYIDFCASWGVFIAGHAHHKVEKAVCQRIKKGTSFGAPTPEELWLAKEILKHLPQMEMIRFVNSGTEAVMSAIRLARGVTARNYVLKFDGCYHGHADHLLASAGSGVAETEAFLAPGVPSDFTKYTLSIPYNNFIALEETFAAYGDLLACAIVEPVAANMGVIAPLPGFLKRLRELTTKHRALLIFDEVITGFRLGLGGAQQRFSIAPDLTTLGKIIGGGFPVGAYAGKREYMQHIAPSGKIYQAGTLSGNPVAMTAGLETLKILSQPHFYQKLHEKSALFYRKLEAIIRPYPVSLNKMESMFTLFFRDQAPTQFADALECNRTQFATFYRHLLNQGIYWSPSPFEAHFISNTHTSKQLTHTLHTIRQALKEACT